MKKYLIPRNKHGLYCTQEGAFTNYSKIVIKTENISSTASNNETLDKVLKSVRKSIRELKTAEKMIIKAINDNNKLF